MQHSTTSGKRSSRLVFKVLCWWSSVCFFAFLSVCAWATPIKEFTAGTLDPGGPVAIGETKMVPVRISIAPQWQSASIRFEVDTQNLQEGLDPKAVHTEKVEIDVSQMPPYTVHVPVRVTGEGLFPMKWTIDFRMKEGEKTRDGRSSGDYPSSGDLTVFAFDGEVFFGGQTELAVREKADRNLLAEKSRISSLLVKQQEIRKGLLDKSALSKEEEETLYEARRKEANRLLRLYYDRYPLKPESKPKALLQPLRQGSSVTLEVNWPINASHTSFLPLNSSLACS